MFSKTTTVMFFLLCKYHHQIIQLGSFISFQSLKIGKAIRKSLFVRPGHRQNLKSD